MVSVPARREQVAFAEKRGLSQRRACTLIKVARSALRYGSRKAVKDAPVLACMRELSAQYPRYGYRRIRIFLGREGHQMSFGRAHRLWRAAKLQVPRKRPSHPSSWCACSIIPQALVAEFAVEALRCAILPGLARIDQCRTDALIDDPLQQRTRHKLGTVVGAQELRHVALTRRDSTSITRPERMRPSTSIARPSLVHSSVTVRHFSCWPFAHQSNTKS